MTLGENKKILYAILDEYNGVSTLTDDEDLPIKVNLIYAPAYQEIAEKIKIVKTASLAVGENSLPTDYWQTNRVLKVVTADSGETSLSYVDTYMIGEKIYANEVCTLEYYAFPTPITEATSDNFLLEVKQNAQYLLPYMVANDILKTDPSSNYTAFQQEYLRKKQELDTRKTMPTFEISGGTMI